MEIKEAGLDQLLECACAAAEGPKMIDCMEKRGNGVPVYTIIARDKKSRSPGRIDPMTQIETTVLSLNRLTRGYPDRQVPGLRVESVLSAIEAGSSFDGDPLEMRYHEESGLLFLHGTIGKLSMAQKVLNILEGDMIDRLQQAGAPTRKARETVKDKAEKRDR